MALLHATQLYVGNVTTVIPAWTTCYTVPAGNRIILREISVRNLAGGAGVTWYVRVAGTLVHTNVLGNGGTSAGSNDWMPWIVATPGQLIELTASVATGVGVVISGSIYTI